MEPHNLVEERLGNRGGAVGVAEGDEMCILGEAINHRENHRFASDLGKAFNKIHGDVGPDGVGNVQRLQQAGWMEMLRLVTLTDGAALHEVADKTAGVRAVEGGAQAVQRLLYAFMAGAVSCGQDLGPQSRRVGDKDAATMQDEAIDGRPVRPSKALVNFLALGDDIRQCLGLRSELVEQIEVRPGECAGCQCRGVLITA